MNLRDDENYHSMNFRRKVLFDKSQGKVTTFI